MTWWKECTRKSSTAFFLPILITFHQVLGITLCIMFTINNNDIASNMLIAIVFYAISLSLMVNIIHTHIYKLPEWWTLKLLLMANIIHTQICKLPDCWILKWSQYDDLICHSWFKWYFHFTAATNETWFFFSDPVYRSVDLKFQWE